MELIIKCSAAAIVASVTSLLIKRRNPEMSFALTAAAVCVVLIAAMRFAGTLSSVSRTVRTYIGNSDAQMIPLLKCLGISCVTKVTTDLCRDTAQSALASSLELAGTVCAAAVSAPLINSLLRLIGEMI